MRAPTPVTKRTMVMESGSTRRRARTRKPPAWIQVNSDLVTARSSDGSDRRAEKTTRAVTKAAAIITVASQPESGSRSRRRPKNSSTDPARGKAGMSQASSTVCCPLTPSSLEQAHVVGRRPLAAPEDSDDQGEADNDFGGRHHQGEEHEHLAADVVEHPGEGDEGQVDGVEHQLDAHEHDQGVAAHEQADGPDGEDHRRQRQVPGAGDLHRLSPSRCSRTAAGPASDPAAPGPASCRSAGTAAFPGAPRRARPTAPTT